MIPASRVLLIGDAFGGKFLPALAGNSGGGGAEYPTTLTKALVLTRDIDTVITGHSGGLAKPQDLEVHRDFMRDFQETTRHDKKNGLDCRGSGEGLETPGTLRRRSPRGSSARWSGFYRKLA